MVWIQIQDTRDAANESVHSLNHLVHEMQESSNTFTVKLWIKRCKGQDNIFKCLVLSEQQFIFIHEHKRTWNLQIFGILLNTGPKKWFDYKRYLQISYWSTVLWIIAAQQSQILKMKVINKIYNFSCTISLFCVYDDRLRISVFSVNTTETGRCSLTIWIMIP